MNFSVSEIIVILLIALLVIKPEQLPDVAFTLGRFAQSIRRLFFKVKNEMNGLIDSVEKSMPEKPMLEKLITERPTIVKPTVAKPAGVNPNEEQSE